ncbi:Hypothetical protein PHPALM_14456 [Phytophthora palmivora]|uniref:Gag protein n=1 Tax=Phytophthora palmivora TaxID=4796 RepID=A0A2P4XUM3_9STRA|nr:Hypothetical protein PHPALM_14456 [Phytophthora palmivora]
MEEAIQKALQEEYSHRQARTPTSVWQGRSRFLACKQGKRELHEYIPDMRVLAASLVRNPLPEQIKVEVFMDGLKVGPSRTQLFRVHANTMADRPPRGARTPTSVWQGHNASSGAVQGAPAAGASTGPVPMELGTAVQSSIRCYGCGKLGHMQRASPAGGQRKFPSKPRGSRGPWQKPRPKSQGNWGHQSADGARHGGLAPERLGALETKKSSGGLLVVHASGYGDPFRVRIDSGASANFARRQTVARNGDKYADALREIEGRGQVSVRLADGTVVNVPGVRMDLAVTFEDFDSTESFLVLDMDKYDLILGMPWLEKHEPWIDWRGKAIGASQPAVSDRALVSNVPTSVPDWGARDGRQGAYAPEEVLGVADSNEDVAMSLATGRETKAYSLGCDWERYSGDLMDMGQQLQRKLTAEPRRSTRSSSYIYLPEVWKHERRCTCVYQQTAAAALYAYLAHYLAYTVRTFGVFYANAGKLSNR